ncbi:MAG: hypothetical protein AB7T06_44810, partial [Kofleriaceae bacterium]
MVMIESAADSSTPYLCAAIAAQADFVDTRLHKMRDLELSRRIDDGIVTPDDLAPLAMTPLGGRGVFLGRLAALAAHEDAALRTAAL